MKTFFKLLAFEFERFRKFFAALIGITVASQVIGIIYESRKYVSMANEMMRENQMTVNALLSQNGPMTMGNVADALWVPGPIAVCIVALIFYSFFIWYREWYGPTTFTYRLFMLPVPRMQIFLSKLTVVFLAVLTLVALQLGLVWVGNLLTGALVPSDYFMSMSVADIVRQTPMLEMLIADSFINFLLRYGIGLLGLIVLFTCILLERSFRGFGTPLILFYTGTAALLFVSPLVVEVLVGRDFFYTSEIFLLMTGAGILITIASLFLSSYLLNRKVTV